MTLAAGTLVNPRVRLLRPLGRGAMGSVWVAEHLTLDTEVAVKFIRAELSPEDSQTLLERFKREASAAAKIKSPHVVQTFDLGFMDDETPYIVMELLEGATLGERLSQGGALSLEEAVRLVTHVSRGLAKAHDIGIVHRDIKPDNLFLVGTGDELLVKILDFGIAKQTELPSGAATASGTLVGTPQYMSPEQLMRAADVGPSVDLWALSVVAYQAIIGQPPFDGETVAGIIVAITHAKYPRPSTLDARFKGAVDHWFDRALSLEPKARFASPKELAATFRDALATVDGSASAGSADETPVGSGAASDASSSSAGVDTSVFIVDSELEVDSDTQPQEPAADVAAADGARDDTLVSAEGSDQAQAMRIASTTPDAAIIVESAAPSGSRSSRLWLVLLAAAVLAVFGWRALRSADESTAAGVASASATATGQPEIAPKRALATSTVTSSAATAASAQAAHPDFRASGVLTLDAGTTPDGVTWLPSFRLVRPAHGGDASYLDAQASCRKRGMALCSDAQWQRACAKDAAVAAVATWTASADANDGFVVRGGPGPDPGCSARAVVAPANHSAERDALCCSRVIGIRRSDHGQAQLQDAATALLQVEKAFSSANTDLLTALSHKTIRYRGRVMLRAAFVRQAAKTFPSAAGSWLLHDTCDLARFDRDGEARWSADCDVVVRQGRKLGYWVRRYVFATADGKLRTIEVPKVYRPSSVP